MVDISILIGFLPASFPSTWRDWAPPPHAVPFKQNTCEVTGAAPILLGCCSLKSSVSLLIVFHFQSKHGGQRVNGLIPPLLTCTVSWGYLEAIPFCSDCYDCDSENMKQHWEYADARPPWKKWSECFLRCDDTFLEFSFWNPKELDSHQKRLCCCGAAQRTVASIAIRCSYNWVS